MRNFEDREASSLVVKDCTSSISDYALVEDRWPSREIVLLHKSRYLWMNIYRSVYMRAAGDLHAAIIASARSKVINKKMNSKPFA